jgi:hypothetical protein
VLTSSNPVAPTVFQKKPFGEHVEGLSSFWNKWFRPVSVGSNHAVVRQSSFQRSSQFLLLTKFLGFKRRLRDGATNACAGDTNTLMIQVGRSKVCWFGGKGGLALVKAKWTRERWAQVGISIQFLALVRTLGEFSRLKYVQGPEFTVAVGEPLVVGALVAAVSCWISVTLFFFRRHTSAICVSIAAIVALLAYKTAAIGW